MSFALFLLYHVVLSSCGGWLVVVVMGGGCSQRLLCLNPTTVMVVLLLGLWLLLDCDDATVLETSSKDHACFTKGSGIRPLF